MTITTESIEPDKFLDHSQKRLRPLLYQTQLVIRGDQRDERELLPKLEVPQHRKLRGILKP
jgi:hypothetical protein